MVVLVDPQPGEAGDALNNRQFIGRLLAMAHGDQLFRLFARRDNERAIGLDEFVDGLQTIPGPGLHALAHGVVQVDADIDFFRLVLRHSFFERVVVRGHDGEGFCGVSVAFRAIAVTAERDARLAFPVRRQNDGPSDVLGQSLLEDSAIDDFDCEQTAHRTSLTTTFCLKRFLQLRRYAAAWPFPPPVYRACGLNPEFADDPQKTFAAGLPTARSAPAFPAE